MQTLTQFKRTQADGGHLAFDDVALKTEQSSRLVFIVAMIRMVSIRFGELALAYGAFVLLKLQQIMNQLLGEAGAQESMGIVHAVLKIWIGCMAFKHALTGTFLGSCGGLIGKSPGNRLWLRIQPRAFLFYVWSVAVLAPTFALAFYLPWSERIDPALGAAPFAILAIELALIGSIFFPLFRRAFALFHVPNFIAPPLIAASNCP